MEEGYSGVITTAHRVGDVAAGVSAAAADANIWCGADHPAAVDDNCLLIVCGSGTGNDWYLLRVVSPGLVIISMGDY